MVMQDIKMFGTIPEPEVQPKINIHAISILQTLCPFLMIAKYETNGQCFCIRNRCALWDDFYNKCGLITKEK
jgi:hypothetical protein